MASHQQHPQQPADNFPNSPTLSLTMTVGLGMIRRLFLTLLFRSRFRSILIVFVSMRGIKGRLQ